MYFYLASLLCIFEFDNNMMFAKKKNDILTA